MTGDIGSGTRETREPVREAVREAAPSQTDEQSSVSR